MIIYAFHFIAWICTMTIYHLGLLILFSVILSLILKNKSSKLNAILQMCLGFLFLITIIISSATPNKIKKNVVSSNYYRINLISTKVNLSDAENDLLQKKRMIHNLFFDESNTLNFNQNLLNWNIGGICSFGIDIHTQYIGRDSINPLYQTKVLSTTPRFDLEYCKAEPSKRIKERYLVALNDDETLKWKHSLVIESEYSTKLLQVIGKSIDWVILYDMKQKTLQILSSFDGSVHYPYNTKNQIKIDNINLAALDSKNNTLYFTTKNKYGDNNRIELVKINLLNEVRESLFNFPRELARFPLYDSVPVVPKNLTFLPEYNLLSIYSTAGSNGKYNDVFQLYDIEKNKVIYETQYKKYSNPILITNTSGTSVGLSFKKNYKIQVLDQYNISLAILPE